MRGDYHSHSVFDDGKSTLLEMAETAERMGLDYFGFSGHSYQPFDDSFCIKKENLEAYKNTAREIQKKFAEEGRKTEIFVGLELDFYGKPEEDMDYIIGSVHNILKDGAYCCVDESAEVSRRMIRDHFEGNPYKMTDAYYDTVEKLPEKTGCSIIGHFDLVTKFNETARLFDAQNPMYLKRAGEVMESLVKKDMILEINTGAISRGYTTAPYPDLSLLKLLFQMGGRIMINSDSHHKDGVAYQFELAKAWAARAGFNSTFLLTKKGFQEVSLKEF